MIGHTVILNDECHCGSDTSYMIIQHDFNIFLKFQKNAFNALLQWCTCPNPCRLNLQSLPAPVKRRLKALKKVQLDATKIEAKFYEEVHKLECKYHEMYKPLYEKRTKITKGNYHINYKITSFLSDECHCGPILTPLMNS